MKTKQLNILNYIRGIAALGVVYDHTFTITKFFRNLIISENFTYTYIYIVMNKFCILGRFGVCLFFLLSGFLIMQSRKSSSVNKFIIHRVFRIYPVAIFSIILTKIFIQNTILQAQIDSVLQTPYRYLISLLLLNDLFLLPILPVFWTLLIEVKFYFLMLFLGRNIRTYHLLLVSIILSTFILVFKYYPSSIGNKLTFSFIYIQYMLIGSTLYLLLEDFIKSNNNFSEFIEKMSVRKLVASILILLFMILIFSTNSVYYNIPNSNLQFKTHLFVILIFIAILVNIKKIKFKSKVLNFFGDLSYPIYVLHVPLIYFMISRLSKLPFIYSHLYLLYLTIFLSIILLAYIFHISIEKPGINLVKFIIRIVKIKYE